MIRHFIFFTYLRGATAHEFQSGRLELRLTHLQGEYWRWKPWRRIAFRWDPDSLYQEALKTGSKGCE